MTVWASEVRSVPIEWLSIRQAPNYFPRGLISVVAGFPDKGKSLFGYWLAAEVSQTDVVIVANAEDPFRRMTRPRLEAAGARLENVCFYNPPALPDGVSELEREIRERRARLLVFADAIANHIAPSIYSVPGVRKALTPLAQVAEETDCAIVGVSHLLASLSEKAHPLQALPASLRPLVQMAFVFGASPDDPDERVLAAVKHKPRDRPQGLRFEIDVQELDVGARELQEIAFLRFLGAGHVSAKAVIHAAEEQEPRRPRAPKREKAAEFLIKYLRWGS